MHIYIGALKVISLYFTYKVNFSVYNSECGWTNSDDP
ncbi:MAG: hypothetical protein ACI9O0_000688 [Paracoccaceae bacterium]|jgi:hypothetical protein